MRSTRPMGKRSILCLLAMLFGMVFLWGPTVERARGDERRTPTAAYFSAFGSFYDGDYKDALEIYLSEGRGAIKTAQSRWIDSICYHTMTGECYFQMGEFPKALDHYNSALKLYLSFFDWMTRVQFQAITPMVSGTRPPTWGTTSRRAKLGRVPSEMLISQGRANNFEQYRKGGVVQQAVLFPIQVQEVVRCTCLAIRRRALLLGPMSRYDSLTAEVTAALSRRPGPPNHWSECWIDVQLGLALAAVGKEEQAVPVLQRSLVAQGELDHPLTCVALLELGILAMGQNNYAAALKYFEEASYSAAYYNDIGVLEEAFRYGANAYFLSNRKGIFPPLQPAMLWAKVKNWRQLHASLTLLAAENFAILNQTSDADRMLGDVRHIIGRRSMGAGWIGSRLNYISGLVCYQQRRPAEGDAAIAAAINYLRTGSIWMFQIAMVDNLYTGGQNAITPRVAMELYRHLLRDPAPADWSTDPAETLTVLCTPHFGPLEHWLEVAIERKEPETALEIADRIRRHRFFSSLSMGGRLLALRWVLNAPAEALDKEAQLQRQDILMRWPGYVQLTQQATRLRTQLNDQPVVPEGPEAFRAQGQVLQQLSHICSQQEAILREIAVRREPANLVFPPLHPTLEVQKSLPSGHALLAFLATSRHFYAFLLNNQRYGYWQLGPVAPLQKRIVELLRQFGQIEGNRELPLKELAEEQWKQTAAQVLDALLKGSQADFTQPLDELVIVPDGVLWYLPFEALQVTIDKKRLPLISRFRIRYLPTSSLIVGDARGRKPSASTGVVLGQLFGHESAAPAKETFERLAHALPGTVALPSPLPAASSLYASLFERLLVLDDIEPPEAPYVWSPIPLDRGKSGSTLNDWMMLPWEGPDAVVLPGYRTAAESALKRFTPNTPGHELFLPICALMASGARTVLMSRWRTGGQTNFDFGREFTQELPHTAPSEALQRCIFLTADTKVNPDAEPRVKRSAQDPPQKAVHPFFWAGYMLIDSSSSLSKEESPATPPADMPMVQAQPGQAAPQGEPVKVEMVPVQPGAQAPASPAAAGSTPAPDGTPASRPAPDGAPADRPAPDGAPASALPVKPAEDK